jgi:hypothetical protein
MINVEAVMDTGRKQRGKYKKKGGGEGEGGVTLPTQPLSTADFWTDI